MIFLRELFDSVVVLAAIVFLWVIDDITTLKIVATVLIVVILLIQWVFTFMVYMNRQCGNKKVFL